MPLASWRQMNWSWEGIYAYVDEGTVDKVVASRIQMVSSRGEVANCG